MSKAVPKLRFKEFNEYWSSCTLADVTKYTKGFAFKSEHYKDNGIRIIRVSDLGADKIKSEVEKLFISEEGVSDYAKYQLKPGNVIITTVGSKPEMIESAVGRGIFVKNENEGLLNQNLLKFENIEGVDNGFIIGLINTKKYQLHIKGIARGNANQANITVVDLLQFRVSIPSFPEQQKIASFLSAVDEKIQQLTRKKELLEQYKKGVMQQLFPSSELGFVGLQDDRIDADDKNNPTILKSKKSKFRQLRFKDENGKAYPKWEEKKLGELAEKVSTKNRSNSVNYVLTNSATQGVVSQSEYFDRDIANQNNLEGYYIVSLDDFVYNPRVSVYAPVGPIKRNKLREGVMSPLYLVFRFKESCLEYFEYYFETIEWHEYLESVANIGARYDRMNISNNDFFNMPIPFPCENERKKIASFLSAIDTKIESVATQIEKTQTFKKGLLQQMFV